MRRREFITLLGGTAVYPLAVRAQTAKVPRVAILWSISPVTPQWRDAPIMIGFLEGLRALGYVEGKNIILELRSAEGKYERFPEILRSLISLDVDVIVATTSAATKAAKEFTQTIPIVMIGITDPVGKGFVQSLARPGGNITGNTDDTGLENAQKRLQLLKELLPAMTTVAHLGAGGSMQQSEVESLKSAAEAVGVKVLLAEHPTNDYTSAFALIARERPDAMFVSQIGSEYSYKNLIIEFAASNRLPTIYHFRDFVVSGGLMSLGVGYVDLYRRATLQIDKILKGAKPSDLPVEQPANFELVVNLKTAKALGLTVPPSILARAEVIE